jgi:hypothetical protein
MTRLPQPGKDDGAWGDILNDFLSVEHNGDGTLKGITTAKLVDNAVTNSKLDSTTRTSLTKADNAVPISQLAVANGVATLDSNSTLTAAQLPANIATTDGNNILTGNNVSTGTGPVIRKLNGTGVTLKAAGDTSQGAWDLVDNGAGGYGVHIVAGQGNTEIALIGVGTDFGSAGGILISGKNAGNALSIGQQSASTGAGVSISGWSRSNYGFRFDQYVGNLPFLLNAQTQAGFPDGVSNGTTTFTSATAAFTAGDVGASIYQNTSTAATPMVIPAGTTIVGYTNSTTVTLSAAVPAATSIMFAVNPRTPSISSAVSRIRAGVASQIVIDVYNPGDAQPTWYLQSNGLTNWGPGGSSAVDTYIRRASPGILQLSSFSIASPGLKLGNVQIFTGSGAPTTIANSADGDIYFRSDGSAGTTLYQRRSGAWTATT